MGAEVAYMREMVSKRADHHLIKLQAMRYGLSIISQLDIAKPFGQLPQREQLADGPNWGTHRLRVFRAVVLNKSFLAAYQLFIQTGQAGAVH